MSWFQENVLQGVKPGGETYAVMVVYFVQGVLGLAALARTYFMKDYLHLSPAELSAIQGITLFPWVIKPLYGFLSDGLPIFGYRRKSYLFIAGVLGSTSWLALATCVETVPQAVVASTLASLGVALSDVVVDSLVVERARDDETASAGALQSLCWSSQAAGGLASAYFSGSLLETYTPQQVFGVTALFPLLVVAIATQLKEAQVEDDREEFTSMVQKQGTLLWDTIRLPSIWLPALFIFLWAATPSSETAFFYFTTGELGIGPEQLGKVRVGGAIASLVGIALYRRFLTDVPIKTTLFWVTLASVPLGLLQLLLVSHANRALGIDDFWFTFGDDVVLTVLGQLAFMPILVLAAGLCPPGLEGTLFATLMSLFNAAGIVGTEAGALLTQQLGVTETNFDNLALLLTICSFSSLLPLLAIDFIDIPPADPDADAGDVIDVTQG